MGWLGEGPGVSALPYGMPLVTLLTDFGSSDSYVAEIKGVLLGLCPAAVLVDVTHAVPPGDIRAGAYLLGRSWHRFPAGTVHFSVVDPGVGTTRAALALRAHGHWFVGPDNGLFTPVLRDAEVEIVTLPTPAGAAPTFHGRDLFAPAAAALARGTPLQALGEPFITMPARLTYTEPHYEGKSVIGEIVYVDRFGTLVTNLTTSSCRRTRCSRSRISTSARSGAPSATCRPAGCSRTWDRVGRSRSPYGTARRRGGWGWGWGGGSGPAWDERRRTAESLSGARVAASIMPPRSAQDDADTVYWRVGVAPVSPPVDRRPNRVTTCRKNRNSRQISRIARITSTATTPAVSSGCVAASQARNTAIESSARLRVQLLTGSGSRWPRRAWSPWRRGT